MRPDHSVSSDAGLWWAIIRFWRTASHPRRETLAFDHTSRRLAHLAPDRLLHSGAGAHHRTLHQPEDRRIAPPKLLDEALAVSRTSVPSADVVNQLEQNSALGEVLASGFRALNANPRCSEADLRAIMEASGRTVAHRLERYLAALATIASAAPLLGLLGTVIGMIEIFGAQAPSAGATMGGANPVQLAHGISVALYNTAFGLIVAIPSLIFWRYFRARVDGYLLTMELASERFVRHLETLRNR
jgi:biopolymer transport protein ExbB